MTTIAMAAGMAPSALGLGDGGGFRSPMAIAVIGGLVMSTLLSLVFVPAAFTILDDFGRLTWRLFGRMVGLTGKEVAELDEAPETRDAPPAVQPAGRSPMPEFPAPAE
jgi:HAE1 family hydrophobic/amphiphilic exporter-1